MSSQATVFALTMYAIFASCTMTGTTMSYAQPLTIPPTLSPQKLKTVVGSVRQKYNLPALGAAVINADEIIVATGGVRKHGDPTPVMDDDKFHLGSCTKSMTATLIAMLVEDGAVQWDTTIESVFPELRDGMRAEYRKVTIQQLLQHRAGLPSETMPTGSGYDDWRRRTDSLSTQRLAYLPLILRETPTSQPDTQMLYSNAGYIIAAAMIERRTKKSWEELMRQRLFQPLGMTSAGFGPVAAMDKIDQPWPHVEQDGKWQPIEPGPGADNPQVMGPAGTVHSSLHDWAKYARFHLRGFAGKEALLKKASFEKLYEKPKDGEYALGWNVVSRPWGGDIVLQHDGSNTQNYAVIWLAPLRNFGVAIATNASDKDNLKSAQACDEIAAAVIELSAE